MNSMKTIYQSIQEQTKLDSLKDYFGEDFVIDLWNRDYILENLNTHDINLLINKLNEYIPKIKRIDKSVKETIDVYCHSKLSGSDEDKFNHILDFYGYYTSLCEWTEFGFKYSICPKYSKNCSKYIYKTCRGVCFHICLTEDVESILKTGLRCKTGRDEDSKYREFPKRIYIVAVPINNIKNIQSVIRDVVYELNLPNIHDYNILRIDIPSQNYNHGAGQDFYQDDAMNNPNTFFTYTNIPAKFIKDLGLLETFLTK